MTYMNVSIFVQRAFVLFSLFMLVGCAAVGLITTTDPAQKLNDANELASHGRFPMAQKIAKEAMAIYEEKNDQAGMARTHSVLGDLNRDGNGPGFPNYPLSVEHFSEAAKIYNSVGKLKWQAFNLYAVAGVQNIQKRKKESCQTLLKSKQIYTDAPEANKLTENFEKAGIFSLKAFPGIEKAFGCSQNHLQSNQDLN